MGIEKRGHIAGTQAEMPCPNLLEEKRGHIAGTQAEMPGPNLRE